MKDINQNSNGNKYISNLLSILFFSLLVFAPANSQSPNTHILGVVMGISKYQNVPSLKYADRDAMSFYSFLLSPAGGSADTNNIRLLLNEKATSYNFFEAMDNLLDMANEGDQVYIYFAGHGDIEKKTERQNGFLIGYNAPPNCYAAGGSISVRFLQDYVETLVSKNKSKVTMIIDACRSGKLAGGSQGAEITALALQTEWKGVTKILSCQPGETSLEGEQWGGGSGVFTYFMLKGMLGQADKDGDEKVSVMELNNFLDENVLRETNKKQLPEIVGDRRQDIARIDKKHALAMLNQMERPIKLPPEMQAAGFEADISSINDIAVLKEYEKFKFYINKHNLISYNDSDKDKETALSIYRSLENSRNAQIIITKMKNELLAALQNKAQIIMNGWVNNVLLDNEEIADSTYKELNTANNIVDSSNIQYKDIKYKYLFFKCIKTKDTVERLNILNECLATNPDDPSVNMEIGIHYTVQRNLEKALYHVDRAIEFAGNFACAWYNKGWIMEESGKPDEALKYYDRALELNPKNYQYLRSKGVTYFNLGRYEESIKYYDKTIELYPDAYPVWTEKGKSLKNLNKFEEALLCFEKSIDLKQDYFDAWMEKGIILGYLEKNDEAMKCLDKAIELSNNFYVAWNNKGVLLIKLKKVEEALKCYNKAIEINPEFESGWYNRACCFSLMKNKIEMLKSLKKAIELNPKFKEDAKKDTDFKDYWNDSDFIEMVK